MKVAFYSTCPYDIEYFQHTQSSHHFTFIKKILDESTMELAVGHDAICISPSDVVDRSIVKVLISLKIGLILVRSSSLDNIDTYATDYASITVKYLPGYSPQAVAEYAAALLISLNRKTHLAFQRMHTGNFSIEGLMGYNLNRKTIGIIGMGRIGFAFSNIMKGFGCYILANDLRKNIISPSEDVHYVALSHLLEQSDIISLHCTVNDTSKNIINEETLKKMKPGAVLINTSRGKLVDSQAVLKALKEGALGAYGADVYEHGNKIFNHTFKSAEEIDDPVLKELIQQPNVLLTFHQAFLTKEALQQVVRTVINELTYYEGLKDGSATHLMV